MSEQSTEMSRDGVSPALTVEELGVFGSPVSEEDLPRILREEAEAAAERARKELHAKMAANMIVEDETRGSYFVREPGL